MRTVTLEFEHTRLNECGSYGWELVNTVIRKRDNEDWVYFYFKRQIKDGENESENPRFDTSLFIVK